jgi:hypothetical protein
VIMFDDFNTTFVRPLILVFAPNFFIFLQQDIILQLFPRLIIVINYDAIMTVFHSLKIRVDMNHFYIK